MVLVNWARSVPPHAKNGEKSAMPPEWQHLLEPFKTSFYLLPFRGSNARINCAKRLLPLIQVNGPVADNPISAIEGPSGNTNSPSKISRSTSRSACTSTSPM
jgi:hypothetical protein